MRAMSINYPQRPATNLKEENIIFTSFTYTTKANPISHITTTTYTNKKLHNG